MLDMKLPTTTKKGRVLLVSIGMVLWALTARAGALYGQVVRVLDGDLLEVLHQGKTERIRLNGIDCPDMGQAYGERAKQAASELVSGKEVMLNTYWSGQGRADDCRRAAVGWHERQLHAGQRRLVLVVSKVRAGEQKTRKSQERSARRQERLVDRTKPHAAVGVAETETVNSPQTQPL